MKSSCCIYRLSCFYNIFVYFFVSWTISKIQTVASFTAWNSHLSSTLLSTPLFATFKNQRKDNFSSSSSSSSSSKRNKSSIRETSIPKNPKDFDRSKRQERVGQVLRNELAHIFHSASHEIKLTPSSSSSSMDSMEEELFKRVSVLRADVSPDLRQARITFSVMKHSSFSSTTTPTLETPSDNDTVSSSSSSSMSHVMDKRRIYSFLVQNTKQIRHALAQRLRHMKVLPELTFVPADVGAAVDVMLLIDKLSKDSKFKRERVGLYGGDDDSLPSSDLSWDDTFPDEEDDDEEDQEEDDDTIGDDDDEESWMDEANDEDNEMLALDNDSVMENIRAKGGMWIDIDEEDDDNQGNKRTKAQRIKKNPQ